ncbi:MAG TPA: hypothetical protein VEB00_12385 [Clostridia bacterium]|nr:hypothetical protein [Clostridia bacterium]
MAMNRFSNSDLLGLPNCIGLSKTGECIWLNFKACKGKECKFKRSAEESRYSRIHTFQRLASLDDRKQTYIANKYYNGRRPWNK